MVKTAAMSGWYSGTISSSSAGNKDKAIKFAMSGCHDTTIAGILSSIGGFGSGHWPPFTSSIAIELFSKTDKTATSFLESLFSRKLAHSARIPLDKLPEFTRKELGNHYVRVRYNDRPVRIPGCAAKPQNHLPGDETFCTLDAFKAIVDKFTPRNWGEECRMNLGEGLFGRDDRFKAPSHEIE